MSAAAGGPALWPSVGEYFVYDELLYHVMTSDRQRNAAYARALIRAAPGRVVADIGSGADGVLAVLAARAGARKVFAIEQNPVACERLRGTLAAEQLDGTVEVVDGSSYEVDLPELADVCVSELIGTIGSAEGGLAVLGDARRLLREDAVTIPARCTTLLAAVSLPELTRVPRFGALARHYAELVFAAVGEPFDLRLCVVDCGEQAIVSTAAPFERLELNGLQPEPRAAPPATLEMQRDATVDGFLLWVEVEFGDETINALRHRSPSWPPAFFPAFHPAIQLSAGDRIAVEPAVSVAAEKMPDYALSGEVRRGPERIPFAFASNRMGSNGATSGLHRALLGESPCP